MKYVIPGIQSHAILLPIQTRHLFTKVAFETCFEYKIIGLVYFVDQQRKVVLILTKVLLNGGRARMH